MKISKEDAKDIRFERVYRMPSRLKKPPLLWESLAFTKIKSSFGHTRDRRSSRKIVPSFERAKQIKQSAFFWVNKLIVNGQVYSGVVKENLPYYDKIMSSNSADGEL